MIKTPFSKAPVGQRKSRRGQTLVEYALILAFIAILAIGILTTLGQQTKALFTGISSQVARGVPN